MSREQTICPALDEALLSLEIELANNEQPKVVLSDFDYTLCGKYAFDAATNNHLAAIDPAVVAAAQAQSLIVATSRRADNPTVPLLWGSGLVRPSLPVIVENGGCALFRTEDGNTRRFDLVEPEAITQLGEVGQIVRETIRDVPPDQQLIMKAGRTMLLARLQDQSGDTLPHHQTWLAERIREVLPLSPLQVVDNRASVTVQHRGVNKGMGFRAILERMGIDRSSIFVVGMGDGPNDTEIFREADLSLGFSDDVSQMVDISIPSGHQAAAQVLETIGNA